VLPCLLLHSLGRAIIRTRREDSGQKDDQEGSGMHVGEEKKSRV